jgi:hypothetical protein
MRWTPSIVPRGDDQNVYLVVDDFGRNGRVYREADVETADLETVIIDLLDGQYQNPIKVVAFNTAEGWSQDVSEDVAQELRRRYAICSCATCRRPFKASLRGMRVTTASLPYGSPDRALPPAKAACRWCEGQLPRIH